MKSFAGIALLVGLPVCLAKAEPESEPASVDVDVGWYVFPLEVNCPFHVPVH